MSGPATPKPQRIRDLKAWTAIALTVAIPAACLAFAAVNVLEASETAAVADRQDASVAQLERRLAERGARPAASVDVGAIYLQGATPALARADLQRLLTETAERVGGRVIEAQDSESNDAPDLTKAGEVRLRLTFDAKNEALIGFLTAVEAGLPLLSVERIEIRSLDAGSDGDPEDPGLRIGVVVAGDGRFAS